MTPEVELERELIVRALELMADGVLGLTLEAADGQELPPWAPGAHIDLTLPAGTEALVRQYSLCGDPGDRIRWQVAVLRELAGRGGSAFVHDQLRPGAHLRSRGPRNHFALIPASRYVFIAGGIGITPLLAMTGEAERAGVPWRLVYGGRTQTSMAYRNELSQRFGERVTLVDQGESGPLDLQAILAEVDNGTAVYCCGPPGLLDAVETAMAGRPGTLHVERFSPKLVAAALDVPFEVELSLAGKTLTVPAGRSILEVVEDAGVAVLSSCREGICGTCETGVLAGTVLHRDSLLTPEEQAVNDTMFICVSRSAGDTLVLEL